MESPKRYYCFLNNIYCIICSKGIPIYYDLKHKLIGLSPFVSTDHFDYLSNMFKLDINLMDVIPLIKDVENEYKNKYSINKAGINPNNIALRNNIISTTHLDLNYINNKCKLDLNNTSISDYLPPVSLPLIQSDNFVQKLLSLANNGKSLEELFNMCVDFKYNSVPIIETDSANETNDCFKCKISIPQNILFSIGSDKRSLEIAKFICVTKAMNVMIGKETTDKLMENINMYYQSIFRRMVNK